MRDIKFYPTPVLTLRKVCMRNISGSLALDAESLQLTVFRQLVLSTYVHVHLHWFEELASSLYL